MKYILALILLLNGAISHAQNYQGDPEEIQALLSHIDSFSAYYMAGDYKALANSYTPDAHIFPSGTEIISGQEAIQKKWTPPEGITIVHHDIMPEEIVIKEDIAYDWGYYEGKTKREGEISSWKGKYVIVWKKVEGDWKIYLDIWNRVRQ